MEETLVDINSSIFFFFAFSAGYLKALCLIEKPVRSLMWDSKSKKIPESLVRDIQAQLKRLNHLYPPNKIITAMIMGGFFLFLQGISRNFDLPSSIIFGAYLICLITFLIIFLKKRIDRVDEIFNTNTNIATIKYEVAKYKLGKLVAFHYVGFLTALLITFLQLAFMNFKWFF
ncbi:MAG: hypothetical protein GDA46_00640 [Bdellovibrionales bacterium]|nr:hypothetical protein [Bdellovibrionales bacterium]